MWSLRVECGKAKPAYASSIEYNGWTENSQVHLSKWKVPWRANHIPKKTVQDKRLDRLEALMVDQSQKKEIQRPPHEYFVFRTDTTWPTGSWLFWGSTTAWLDSVPWVQSRGGWQWLPLRLIWSCRRRGWDSYGWKWALYLHTATDTTNWNTAQSSIQRDGHRQKGLQLNSLP